MTGACRDPGSSTPPPSATEEKASAAEEYESVASHAGSDEATGGRIHALLQAQGVESLSFGSAGYTVAVKASQAEKARQILQQAVDREGLKAMVIR